MAQKKQVSRLKDLKKSKKCSQYQMYDSRLKKCVEVKGRGLPFMIGKGGLVRNGGKKPLRPNKGK